MPDPRAKFVITAGTDFAKAQRESKTFLKSLQSAARVAVGSLAVGSTAAATGIARLATDAARSADALAKQADKLGLATEKLAALQLAGRLTGVQNEKLILGLQRMTRRIAEAAQGAGEAQGALKELGLDARELANLTLDQQFQAVAAAMAGVARQGDRIRLGQKLFDSEGVDLIRTLNAMGEGFADIEAEARAFGVAISRVDARRIEMATDAIERARTAAQGIGTTVAIAASTIAGNFANSFADAAKEANGFRGEINATMESVVASLNFAANVVRGIQLQFLGLKLALLGIQEAARESLNKGTGILRKFRTVARGAVGAVTKGIADADEDALDRIRANIDKTSKAIEVLVSSFKSGEQAIQEFRAAQDAAIQAARDSLSPVGTDEEQGASAGLPIFGEKEREQLAQRLAAVQRAFQSEVEALRETFLQREAIIQEAFDRELVSEEERNALRLQNAEDTANRVLAIEQKRLKRQEALEAKYHKVVQNLRSQAVSTGISLLQTLGSRSESLAKAAIVIEKGLAVARIIMNTNAAAAHALAQLGPIAGPPMAARITAWGYGLAAATAALGLAQASLVGQGSTGAPLGTPTNPVFTEGFTAPPENTGSQEPAIEVHIHGSVFNNRETGDQIGEIIRGLTDRNVVIIRGNTRQAAVVRGGG